AGDDIYFRVGSVNDGANDDVVWSPTITYTKIAGVADADVPNLPADVNGLSQVAYVAADDFTLSGRPDTMVFMPYQGPARFSATGSMAWSTGTATTRDAELTFAPTAASPAGTAIVTVKTRQGVVARATVTVPASPLGLPVTVTADLNAALQGNTDYWFDVSTR